MIELLVALYRFSPLLGIVVQTATVLLITTVAGRGVVAALRKGRKQLAGGPILLFSALLVSGAFALLLVSLVASGRSFEQAVLEWSTGRANVPVEELGPLRFPFVLGLTYGALYGVFSSVALLVAWLVGMNDRDAGGVAKEVETELGTGFVERFYKLAGFHHASVQELRFAEWCRPLVRYLRLAQWLSLPAAITGALSPPLWALLSIVIEGLALNLVDPPKAPEESQDEADAPSAPPVALKDPAQLVRALSIDPRGPELSVRDGGFDPGAHEHVAERTRLREESTLVRDAFEALGFAGTFVHQEAASEALLEGKSVLMETPPLSGRRTLGDLFALRTVLVEGGTVLFLSPDAAESERRAKAFRELSARCNWRWAIHHHDLATHGRLGISPELRPPQILFATAVDLHRDVCARHREWADFLGRLRLVVAVDLDRYTGARAASVAFVMRRLLRLSQRAGGKPRVLASVAPFGPDVLGHAEALMGTTFHVVGPESDSRGAAARQIVVATPNVEKGLHPAVGARGVAIACGYRAETWDYDGQLTTFEREQQVNQVLLTWGHAVVQSSEGQQSLLDRADALVMRLSAEKAALLHFFTRHVGRASIGAASSRAREVGVRREREKKPVERFAGFVILERELDAAEGAEAPSDAELQPTTQAETGEDGAQVELRADRAVSIWIPDDDPFARLIARNPAWLTPADRHPLLALGSKLVTARDATGMATRHLLAAASEAPLRRTDAMRDFPSTALDMAQNGGNLLSRRVLVVKPDGSLERDEELSVEVSDAQSFDLTASGKSGKLLDASDRSLILETDRECLPTVAYPGRVLMVGGRRYRVLLPEEQGSLDEGILYAVPERRRTRTARVRKIALRYEGTGSELRWGGTQVVRLLHAATHCQEQVFGLRSLHPARGPMDELFYQAPIVSSVASRSALLLFEGVATPAGHGLVHLVRSILPAYVRHGEDDLDVVWLEEPTPALAFIDRHVGEAGFARAITSDVLRHVLSWCRILLDQAEHRADCEANDGCEACVRGVLCQSLGEVAQPSRRETRALLESVLGAG